MITLSELQTKEVITIETGKRLGHIYDLEIDPVIGKIIAIILIANQKQQFFGKSEEIVVRWEQIMTIGIDVILVREKDVYPLLDVSPRQNY